MTIGPSAPTMRTTHLISSGPNATVFLGTYNGEPAVIKRYTRSRIETESLGEFANRLERHWRLPIGGIARSLGMTLGESLVYAEAYVHRHTARATIEDGYAMIETIRQLHSRNLGHGDPNPTNWILAATRPVLIDRELIKPRFDRFVIANEELTVQEQDVRMLALALDTLVDDERVRGIASEITHARVYDGCELLERYERRVGRLSDGAGAT